MSTKNIILISVAVIVALGLLYTGCRLERSKWTKTVGTVKAVTKDSIQIRYKPVPYKITKDSLIYVKGKPVLIQIHDTLPPLIERVTEKVDSAKILEAYFATSYYHNKIDTGRWSISRSDTVTQNRITGSSWKVVSSDTTTTNTIQRKPSKNFVGYWTLSGMGNVKNLFGGAGFGLGLKTPGETVYQAELKYLDVVSKNRIYGEIRVMIPIKLNKK